MGEDGARGKDWLRARGVLQTQFSSFYFLLFLSVYYYFFVCMFVFIYLFIHFGMEITVSEKFLS